MAKIGRNHPCPCGNGRKYKHCHGILQAEPTPNTRLDLDMLRRRAEAQHSQRRKQQGLGKPIISMSVGKKRVVVVGNTVYISTAWLTFHDFLRQFLVQKLGVEWFKLETAKNSLARHPVVRWYRRSLEGLEHLKPGELYHGPMTGAHRAYLNLAYNLYLIEHHAEPQEAAALVATFVTKLKSDRTDDFIGKLFETYAAAAFLKAGFKLAFENEADGATSHVEFVAEYPATGKKFSVEVKSRNRAGEDGPIDDYKRLRVSTKLTKALAKKADHARVVMIEVNVPDVLTNSDVIQGWPLAALDQIKTAAAQPFQDGTQKPSAYVIVTNHAFHNNLDAPDTGTQAIAAGCNIPDFGPDVGYNRLKAVLESEARHREVLALMDSLKDHYQIPATFDGENPEIAFDPAPMPRLQIGEMYLIPDDAGKEVPARLVHASVIEETKTAMGIYSNGKSSIMASNPLTDAEMAAYRLHPETFFGEVSNQSRTAKNWLELGSFFYETYRHTPKEQLLEWMGGLHDIKELEKLDQTELAITYCERLALSAERRPPSKESNAEKPS